MLSSCFIRTNALLGRKWKNLPLFCARAANRGGQIRPRLSPVSGEHVQNIPPVSSKIILRCGIFTTISVSTLLCGSAVWSFEHWRAKAWRLKHGSTAPGIFKSFTTQVRSKLEHALGRPFQEQDIFWILVACNLLVYLCHHSPLRLMTLRYFTNSPYGPTPATSMFLSVFSHYSLFHLAINMYVLHSFTPTLIRLVGPADFLYLFIGGGIFASFFSLINKSVRRSIVPSLGASGGICAVLGAFCLLQPSARLCVPFVVDVFPHSFEAKSAVQVLFILELLASIFLASRSPIDHAAHMGGLLFGICYSASGMEAIWQRRNAIVSLWRKWRRE